jgi:SAM-dependent methyltransferase
MSEARRSAPAALRNRNPIAEVLRDVLPVRGLVLEIASGTGEHAAFFAQLFPSLTWQPSDSDPDALSSIEAWAADAGAANLRPPVFLNAASPTWPVDSADAIICVNMVHISPWSATAGLMRGAGLLLGAGAPLALYGPYRRAGVETAPSNEAFDLSLRSRNPDWGLRDLEAVAEEAAVNGLELERVVEMPANNLSVVFRRL